jgi:hypothetical protein
MNPPRTHDVTLVLLPDSGPGLWAWARPLARLLAPGAEEVALGLGGLGFSCHAFSPEDNHAWRTVYPERRWLDALWQVDHFGVLESWAAHYGRSLALRTGLMRVEQAALCQLSAREGWPLLAQSAGRWGWVGEDPTSGEALDAIQTQGVSIALDRVQCEGPLDTLIAIRPSPHPASLSTRHLLQREVLRFALQHAQTGREIAQDHDVFVASGVRAWSVMRSRLAEAEGDAEGMGHVRMWGAVQRDARRAAESMLAAWARGLDQGEEAWAPVPGGPGALARAAICWGHVADLLAPWNEADPAQRATLCEEAEAATGRALRALAEVLEG